MNKGDTSSISHNGIDNNNIGRDLNIGTTTVNFNETKSKSNALTNLLIRSKQLCETDQEYRYMLEELQEYLKPRSGRKIIGLEGKLKEGNRLDLLEEATYLENKFARRVSKHQFSRSEEVIYCHCLSKINSSFAHYIKPLFKKTVSPVIIDKVIYEKIIEPLYEETSEVSTAISIELIRGMIFFLTGKCHLRWIGS